jgi:hypothetical protein
MPDEADRLDFCKQALGEIGTRSTITSLAPPDGSPEAFYCNLFLDSTRDQLLRAAHWNFAGRTEAGVLWKALPGTPENPTIPAGFLWSNRYPAPPWLYSYRFPADSPIQIRRVREQLPNGLDALGGIPLYSGGSTLQTNYNQLPCAVFEVANDRFDPSGVRLALSVKVILTNARNAVIDFTTSDIEVAEYDAIFADAMMLALEGKLALALLGDKAMHQAKLQEANNAIMEARVRDGNEGLTLYDPVPDWLQVRGVASLAPAERFFPAYGPLFAV